MFITKQNDELADAQHAAGQAVRDQLNKYIDLLPANRHAEARAITAALTEAESTARTTAAAIHAAKNNLDIHPDGRRARADQALEEGSAKVRRLYSDARARAQVLSAALEGEALAPPEGAADAALARQDAALILGMAKNPTEALHTLATDTDLGIVALVAGPWGERYLAAAGVQDRADVMHTVRTRALTTIAESGNSTPRARAAKARLEGGVLDAAIAGSESLATAALN